MKFSRTTFLNATNIFDRYIAKQKSPIPQHLYQSAAINSIWLSAKVGEYDSYIVPLVFNSPSANVCDWNFIKDSELIFLEELCWDVEGVTPASFIDPILHRLHDFNDKERGILRKMTLSIASLCAMSIESINHSPSKIAGACVVKGIRTLMGKDFTEQNVIQEQIWKELKYS